MQTKLCKECKQTKIRKEGVARRYAKEDTEGLLGKPCFPCFASLKKGKRFRFYLLSSIFYLRSYAATLRSYAAATPQLRSYAAATQGWKKKQRLSVRRKLPSYLCFRVRESFLAYLLATPSFRRNEERKEFA